MKAFYYFISMCYFSCNQEVQQAPQKNDKKIEKSTQPEGAQQQQETLAPSATNTWSTSKLEAISDIADNSTFEQEYFNAVDFNSEIHKDLFKSPTNWTCKGRSAFLKDGEYITFLRSYTLFSDNGSLKAKSRMQIVDGNYPYLEVNQYKISQAGFIAEAYLESSKVIDQIRVSKDFAFLHIQYKFEYTSGTLQPSSYHKCVRINNSFESIISTEEDGYIAKDSVQVEKKPELKSLNDI